MTLFLHAEDFYYPKKMKTCLFTRAGGRMCVQSKKPRLEKSPAICLGPSLPGLHPSSLFSEGLLEGRAPAEPGGFSPLHSAIRRGWSDILTLQI